MLPDPPANGMYMVAAYVVTIALLGGYAVGLWRRVKKTVASGK